MQKISKPKNFSTKSLVKSLSARISPLPISQKHSIVCFDIDYLKKKSEHKTNRLKIQQTASTVVSPKYHNPKKIQAVQKRYNKSVPDTFVCGNQKINEIMNYVQDLKEKLKSVRNENKMIGDMLKVQVKEKNEVWKSVEKFRKKLKVKLK